MVIVCIGHQDIRYSAQFAVTIVAVLTYLRDLSAASAAFVLCAGCISPPHARVRRSVKPRQRLGPLRLPLALVPSPSASGMVVVFSTRGSGAQDGDLRPQTSDLDSDLRPQTLYQLTSGLRFPAVPAASAYSGLCRDAMSFQNLLLYGRFHTQT